jgi:thymidylate kinase
MARPDHVIVLAVDPDTAVRRKTTEPERYVRARAERTWAIDWSASRAVVIDATRPQEQVIAELEDWLWRAL